MSKKQVAEKMIDGFILSAIEKEDECLAASVPPDGEIAQMHTFSPEFEKKMQTLIRSERGKAKVGRMGRRSLRAMIAVAAVVSVILALAVYAGAFKVDLFTMMSRFAEKYLAIEMKTDEEDILQHGSVVDVSKIPTDWTEYWVPSYMPEGYEITTVKGVSQQKKIDYTNSENNIITFNQWGLKGNSIFSDTEDTTVKTVNISGGSGYLFVKDTPAGKRVIINWGNKETAFKIEGILSEKELVKMAESIILIKN